MKKIMLFCWLCLCVVQSYAQQEKKLVGLSVWSGYPTSVQGFKDGLEKHGFIEGENVSFLYGNAQGNNQTQQNIANHFLANKVDLVYSLTTPGTIVIKETMAENTPIVFSIVTYPADSGLIEAFDYSGNNLVGTSNFIPLHHYVDLLLAALPKAKTLAIFHRKGEPNSKIQAVNLIRLFKRKGIKVIDLQPQTIEETRSMAESLVGEVDGFITTTDTLMQDGAELALIAISKEHNIPILSSNKKGIEQGATFGPVADFYILGQLSGDMAGQILKGSVKPHELMSKHQEPPTFLVNKARMGALNITLNDTIGALAYVD